MLHDQTNNQHDYSRKPLFKGLITGALILLLLIPASFVNNLVKEREERQKEVVSEVSNKWAGAQVFTSPYLVIPFNGKDSAHKIHQLILLPEQLKVTGKIIPATRTRSIYNVLLYNSELAASGSFDIHLPLNVAQEDLHWSEAKICIGINDFRGLQEEVMVDFNSKKYLLQPGLPYPGINNIGLSSVVDIDQGLALSKLSFSLSLKLKGSQELSFVPLAANSSFDITSTWPHPSFNGNTLPVWHQLNHNGFCARWKFIGANLPFTTSNADMQLNKSDVAFGVTMLQPADQYAKTSRCTKYAILFIGLTFALFFIMELLQKKPFHPVQYVLVGLALIIFYTLLLSVGEFVIFNAAYLIASGATILLISFYSWLHFQSIKVAAWFLSVLTALYVFIFILISLEDTALLIGSIGLFIVLALVMFASRKINWYGTEEEATAVLKPMHT